MKTWGDGISCVSEDVVQLAEFALRLSKGFDGKNWKGNIHKPLRLRTALHMGYVYPSPEPYSSGLEQYTGTEMVKPARLEPMVRPEQVWCTSEFKETIYRQVDNVNAFDFVFDDLREIQFAKDFGSDSVYRIRYKRENEEELRQYEREMKEAQKIYDTSRFLKNLDLLLKATSPEFVYLSEYLSWYEVGEAMIDMGLFAEAEQLIIKLKNYVEQQGWLSEEMKVYLNCLLANCASNRNDSGIIRNYERALWYIEEIAQQESNRSEIDIIIAITYKKMGMAYVGSRLQDHKKRDLFLKSNEKFFRIFTQKILYECIRFYWRRRSADAQLTVVRF